MAKTPRGKKRKAESREGMVTLTVAFEPDFHRRLAMVALESNAALVQIIRDACSEYLDRHARKRGKQ
jgi:hypothetical protein